MRVLLVEDDLQIGQSLMRALKDASYSVDWVRDGLAGRAAMEAAEYTVVLLDLGLPGMSGIELLRSARAGGNAVPVLILTARDDLDSRIEGLDIGALSSHQKSTSHQPSAHAEGFLFVIIELLV